MSGFGINVYIDINFNIVYNTVHSQSVSHFADKGGA